MKILSNDYRSNLPTESSVAHGGPANFARAFSAHAVKRGHAWVGLIESTHQAKTTKITRTSGSTKKIYYTCQLSISRYRPFLTLPKKQDSRIWFKEEIATVREFIQRINPDVVFLNGFSVCTWILMEAASQEGLPIVIQHAGIARVEFEQYKHLYSLAGRKMMLAMEQDIVKAATTQVFLNNHSRDAFSLFVAPTPANKSLIIPLPYDETYARRALALKKKGVARTQEIIIGCVARWDRIKNHRAVLAIAREAAKQGLPWTFRSVTRVPETSFDHTFKTAYRRTINVIPPMPQEELLSFYDSVDLMILPSHFDVSPGVVMEAALAGKPTLISTGVGWNSEYMEFGLKDWIADFSDPKRIVRTIKQHLKKPLSPRFQTMVRTKHAPNTVFTAYLRAFTHAKHVCASLS